MAAFKDICKSMGKTVCEYNSRLAIATDFEADVTFKQHRPDRLHPKPLALTAPPLRNRIRVPPRQLAPPIQLLRHIQSCIHPPFMTSTARAPRPQLSGKHCLPLELTLMLTCDCSSSGVAGSTGFATGTGAPIPTGTGSPSGGAGSGPGATGSPINPSAPIGTGNAGGNAPFTGSASKTVGSFAAAALAIVGLTLTL